MPNVVITGAPGAGKTTLLSELAKLGYRTVPESARAIIAERRALGLSPRPGPAEFAAEILRRDAAQYREAPATDEWVFFDRSAVEALAMVHEATPLPKPELQARLAEFAFHPTVFILPPWPAIYTNDAERDHSYGHAERVHADLIAWYEACGYRLQEVPRGTPIGRARHVLQSLGLRDA